MNHKSFRFGLLAMLGVCLLAHSVSAAYVIPINSRYEKRTFDINLMIESEMTRWKQEALKYKEMMYTDMMGKAGGGSLGKNKIIEEMKDAAKDGTGAIGNTTASLRYLSNLSNYDSVKDNLAEHYVVRAEKGIKYTQSELEEIYENQRVAIDELARAGITQAAVEIVGAEIDASNSTPEKRAQEMAKAKDLNAMYELVLGMDRRNYERSLRISALDATDAGIQAMQVLQGISKSARNKLKK